MNPHESGPTGGEGPEAKRLWRAREIFFQVRTLALAAREDAIDLACAEDHELRELVLLLLRGDEAPLPIEALADELQAAAEHVGTRLAGKGPISQGGDRIGHYRLLERIGEGGFGVVFAAEQTEPVKRIVALKVLKMGMDTRQIVTRFEAERQALAMMDHPNIAKVFDGGATPTGRPYFAMELVRGEPLTTFCDRFKLSIPERLELFAAVCDAVQHAHGKGVIHRDIKPGNVLTSMSDGRPVVKVIDFGIAKAVDRPLTEKTLFTEHKQLIGTPDYMSPEQAEGTRDIDTRTDVYALGVLLYELLTGLTPFDSNRLRSAGYGEMQRIIREVDPPRPSTRLSSAGVILTSAASSRRTEPLRLAMLIRRELDWVVMKAIEKDRSRRYESVSALAADLKRYLGGDAVLAVPPSAGYRARKFVRRYRGPVIAGGLVALSLVGGLVGTSLGFFNAQRERKVAEAERARAQREKERADENAADAHAAEELATRRAYSASLMSASTAIDSVQYGTARTFLDGAPERLRGWEWGVLHAKLDTSIRGIATGDITNRSDVPTWSKLKLAPDQRSFFTHRLRAKETLKRWDLNTGRLLQAFELPFEVEVPNEVTFAAVSPDGTRLSLSAGFLDGRRREIPGQTWELATGQRIAAISLGKTSSSASHAAIFGDGSRMLLWETGSLRLLSLPGGNVIAQCGTEGFPNMNPVFSADESLMAENSSRSPNELIVRRTSTLEEVCVVKGHGGMIWSADFSADSRWLGTAAEDGTARVWDLSVSPPKGLVLPHEGGVTNICFTPDAARVATICKDHAIRVWDRATGTLLATFVSEGLVCGPLMFVPDGGAGNAVAGIDDVGTVRFWDVRAASTSVLRGHTTIVSGVRWAKGNPADIVVTSSWDGHGQTFGVAGSTTIARFWDADSGEQVGSLAGRLGDIAMCEAVNDDGRLAAFSIVHYDALLQGWSDASRRTSESVWGRAEVIDLATGARVFSAPISRNLYWICFAADHRSIIVADNAMYTGEKEAQLHLLDGRSGEQLRTRSLDPKCWWTFGRAPDGRVLAALPSTLFGSSPADRPRTMLLIDAQTLEVTREIDGIAEGQLAIGFSPDGQRVVTGGFDGVLHVYDVSTGTQLATMSGHSDNILTIAFSPDGSRIASGGLDRKVRIWDAKTYEQLAALSGHEGHINTLEWQPLAPTAERPAGDWRLFSSSGDSTARVWEPRPIRTRVEARDARKVALEQMEPMVAKLFDELKDAAKVVERINADASLSALQRKTALQVALKRGLETQAQKR